MILRAPYTIPSLYLSLLPIPSSLYLLPISSDMILRVSWVIQQSNLLILLLNDTLPIQKLQCNSWMQQKIEGILSALEWLPK